MGTVYELPSITETTPGGIEGVHVSTSRKLGTGAKSLTLTVNYRLTSDPESEILKERYIHVDLATVLKYGGTPGQWEAVRDASADPSDVDDLIEEMCLREWGLALLWACWHGVIGA